MSQPDTRQVLPTESPIRRLKRSRRDRVLGGVCGGLGQYLGVDAVVVRVVAIALALSGGVGVLGYLIAWIIIPDADGDEPVAVGRQVDRHAVALIAGAALVALGVLLLVHEFVPWFGAAIFWPLVVVAAGITIITSGTRR